MTSGFLIIMAIAIIIGVVAVVLLSYWGIKLALAENGGGLVPLFIALNLIGVIIGFAIIQNKKDKRNNAKS